MAAAAELRQVARLHRGTQADAALEWAELTRDRAQQGGLAGAVGAHDADPVAPLRLQARGPCDGDALRVARQRREAEQGVAQGHHEIAGTDRSAAQQRALAEGEASAPAWCLRSRVLQRIEAALVLVHLGVLAMAPVALHQLAFALDGLTRRLRLLALPRVGGLPLQQVRRIAAPEEPQPSIAQLPDAAYHGIEERSVVRGHQEGAVTAHECLLEPLQGGDVKVVGGLVEQQQVRIGHQQPGQGRTRLLAAGEARGRAFPVSGLEAEPGEGRLDVLVEVVAVAGLEAGAQLCVGLRLDTFGAEPLQTRQLLLHRLQLGRARAHGVAHARRRRERGVEVGFLAEHADAQAALARHQSPIGLVEAGREAEQGRLPYSVRAHDTDPLAVRERGRQLVEDHERADLPPRGLETQDRHRPAS